MSSITSGVPWFRGLVFFTFGRVVLESISPTDLGYFGVNFWCSDEKSGFIAASVKESRTHARRSPISRECSWILVKRPQTDKRRKRNEICGSNERSILADASVGVVPLHSTTAAGPMLTASSVPPSQLPIGAHRAVACAMHHQQEDRIWGLRSWN